jgi:hypothetical protein
VDGAGAALRNTATELRAREAQNVAQGPEQRHVAVDVNLVHHAIDMELKYGH